MVGGHEVDRSILHSFAQSLDILRRPQRRIHFRVGVVASDAFLRQRQMVRTRLGGDVDSAILSPANQFHRAFRAHMGQVHMAAGETREKNVANDHDLLRLRRDSLETKLGADDSFVHRPAR